MIEPLKAKVHSSIENFSAGSLNSFLFSTFNITCYSGVICSWVTLAPKIEFIDFLIHQYDQPSLKEAVMLQIN